MTVALDDIGPADLERALAVLARGFPEIARERWARGLSWLAGARGIEGLPLGRVLRAEGVDVGVILTLGSRRADDAGVVNLSSWFVDPAFRVSAPLMLRRATAARDLTYTSLTPLPGVERMLTALGFERASAGRVILPVALAALRPSRARMRSLARVRDALPEELRRSLDDHAAVGSLCAALEDEDGLHPLVFFPRRRAGLRTALLAYAEDGGRVLRHRGAVARHLLRHGVLALTVDHPGEEGPSELVPLGPPRRYVKGPRPTAGIDYLYSELPAFGV
ncbi:MAG TPA: hypothetical protein VM434_14325 [Beijerinckiaceae bacterium]|nr:hypothetical protein [Beijerinckiaceae bacterium]